jgi:hypothetical protein
LPYKVAVIDNNYHLLAPGRISSSFGESDLSNLRFCPQW